MLASIERNRLQSRAWSFSSKTPRAWKAWIAWYAPCMAKDRGDVESVLAALEQAQAALSRALRDGRDDLLLDLNATLQRLERERSALIRRRTAPRGGTITQGPAARSKVLAALKVAQRPVASRLLADIARARFGFEIETRALASLRRDELRSWRAYHGSPDKAVAKPDLIVPALSHDRFTPERGILALSSWDLSVRIVAPASGRVDVLHVACNLAYACIASPAESWTDDVARVVGRIGLSTKPFAGTLALPTPEQVLDAASHELDVIAPSDRRDRSEAADRAAQVLDEEDQLFGAAPLGVVPIPTRKGAS